MNAKVFIRLKPGVLDVQGKAVERGLAEQGQKAVRNVRIGKLIEFEYAGRDEAAARKEIETLCRDLLANTIIEDFEITLK